MVARPGFKTSEFLIALLNVVAQIVAAAQGYIGDGTAVKFSLAGFLAYIVSRGLAKTEVRGTTVPPVVPPVA